MLLDPVTPEPDPRQDVSTSAAPAPSNLGRYHILKHLASGGMAELYLARATGIEGFERYVVVKKILGDHAKDSRFVKMFLDEARLAAQLHHQNIAQVYDCGQDGGTYYFAMEYVHGENVRDVLKKIASLRKQIPLEHALTMVAGAAAGLHHAHERRGADRQPLGIVHRDVSPSNLLVAYDGAVKVVDFGIAKAASRMTETRSGTLKGKIAYMSPEQCLGKSLDRRSDVFALGIVMYELTTVSRLFKGDNDYITMNRIVTGDIAPPSKKRPDYPPGLEAIVMKALALDPADRYQTAAEMLEAIEQFCVRERIALSAIGLGRFVRELFGEKPEPWLDLVGPPVVDDMGAVEITRSNVDSGVTGLGTMAAPAPPTVAMPVPPSSGGPKSASLVLATSGSSSDALKTSKRGWWWVIAAAAAAGAITIGFAIGRRGSGATAPAGAPTAPMSAQPSTSTPPPTTQPPTTTQSPAPTQSPGAATTASPTAVAPPATTTTPVTDTPAADKTAPAADATAQKTVPAASPKAKTPKGKTPKTPAITSSSKPKTPATTSTATTPTAGSGAGTGSAAPPPPQRDPTMLFPPKE
jgi:serine/threonine protein kinase